jgi:hypothetical protein
MSLLLGRRMLATETASLLDMLDDIYHITGCDIPEQSNLRLVYIRLLNGTMRFLFFIIVLQLLLTATQKSNVPRTENIIFSI